MIITCVRSQVIKESRPRTKRWISSSIPEERWDSNLAQYSSPDYHVNNLVSPVLFQEALQVSSEKLYPLTSEVQECDVVKDIYASNFD